MRNVRFGNSSAKSSFRSDSFWQFFCQIHFGTFWVVFLYSAGKKASILRFLLNPEIFTTLSEHAWFLGFVVLMLAGIAGVLYYLARGREPAAFLSSSAFLLGLLGATMAGIYPVWLRSTLDPAYSLTAENAAAGTHSLRIALVWWIVGIALAAAYFVNLYRSTRGKVDVHAEEYGESVRPSPARLYAPSS